MATKTVVTGPLDKLRDALSKKFPSAKAEEIFLYFNRLMGEARREQCEWCITDGGKFVEAVLKCFHYLRTGDEVNSIKAEEEVRQLEQATSLSEFERMTIPRALRLMYEIRNRRGGAHNSSFDPIRPDCVLVVAIAKWVMEELTRLYLTNDAVAAQEIVEGLLVKDISLIQEIDGDRVVLVRGLSARIQLEIIFWREHPRRLLLKDLVQWTAHNHRSDNIRTTLHNMKQKNVAHETEAGWILTDAGLHEAEVEVVKLLQADKTDSEATSKRRTKGIKRGRK